MVSRFAGTKSNQFKKIISAFCHLGRKIEASWPASNKVRRISLCRIVLCLIDACGRRLGNERWNTHILDAEMCTVMCSILVEVRKRSQISMWIYSTRALRSEKVIERGASNSQGRPYLTHLVWFIGFNLTALLWTLSPARWQTLSATSSPWWISRRSRLLWSSLRLSPRMPPESAAGRQTLVQRACPNGSLYVLTVWSLSWVDSPRTHDLQEALCLLSGVGEEPGSSSPNRQPKPGAPLRYWLLHSMLLENFLNLNECKVILEICWLPRADPTMQISNYYNCAFQQHQLLHLWGNFHHVPLFCIGSLQPSMPLPQNGTDGYRGFDQSFLSCNANFIMPCRLHCMWECKNKMIPFCRILQGFKKVKSKAAWFPDLQAQKAINLRNCFVEFCKVSEDSGSTRLDKPILNLRSFFKSVKQHSHLFNLNLCCSLVVSTRPDASLFLISSQFHILCNFLTTFWHLKAGWLLMVETSCDHEHKHKA